MDRRELANKIRALEGLSNDEKSALLALLNSQKKYGLVWEDKPENVELQMVSELPVLTEVKERAIISEDADAPNHILIEGDNLHALTALTYTHAGKIDVIYIDPPYNTGNKDFIYNDSYVDKEDAYRHSKWLSFMAKRLEIAKTLLSDRGVIFISIDDNEQAQLKLLCDEIFGENNFVADIAWQRTYSPRNDSQGISAEKEHLIVYGKIANWSPCKLPRTEKMNKIYKNPDNDIAPWRNSDAFAPSASTHQGMVYAIQHPFTGELIYPYKGACWPLRQSDMLTNMQAWGRYELRDLNDAEARAAVCGISPDEVRQGVLGIVLTTSLEEAQKYAQEVYDRGRWPRFFFTNKGKGGIARKTYLENTDGRVVTNLWNYEEVGHTDEASKELKAIFGDKPFSTPKPTRLISRIIQISSSAKDISILDFFAGSGTTLHATMQLNADDGGHRQCILITNNENNICEEVTYVRNQRVIQGYTTPKGEAIEGLHSNNLRYYRTSFVPRARTVANMRALTNAATDLLCIRNNVYKEIGGFGGKRIPSKIARYFNDGKTKMLVIYAEAYVSTFVNLLLDMEVDGKILVYVFSNSNYAYDDNFEEVADKVELCALPDAIYKAYKKALPLDKAVQEAESPSADETANANEEDAQ